MNLVTIDTSPGNMSLYLAPNNTKYLEMGLNASTVVIGYKSSLINVSGILNASNASFINMSITNINGQPYGSSSANVSSNMSFINLSVTGNFSMPSTAIMNVSNSSFTNVSLSKINSVYLNTSTTSNVISNVSIGFVLTLNNSSILSAYETTAFGINTGTALTTGLQNTLFGGNCGVGITTGNANVGVGPDVFTNITTGNYNVAMGQSAICSTGININNNTAIGTFSQNTANGNYNTAIGSYSDQKIQNTGSNYNVAIGANSSTSNVTGTVTYSTAIGSGATTGGFSNSTALGYNATCTAANQIMLGTNAESVISQGIVSAISFSSTSDLRMKDIIRQITLEEGEQFINNNNPVLFKWKNNSNLLNSGYIAQELINSGFPHLVSELNNPELKEPDGPNGKQYILNYDGIIPYHGVVIKHLLNEINEMKIQMKEIKEQIKNL